MFKAVAVVLLLAGLSARAGTPDVFDSFKTLKGKWRIEAEGKILPIEMNYEDGSRGSVVTEQFGKELSVIFKEGDKVLMTHYCNSGNQPRLKLKTASAKLIEFETFEVANLKTPDAPHVKKIIYNIVDEKNMRLELVWKRGQGQESEIYTLTRI